MSQAMLNWASQQMRKIGKNDLTLLEFCMTLTDAAEIRQYFATCLGSTPEVMVPFLPLYMLHCRLVLGL